MYTLFQLTIRVPLRDQFTGEVQKPHYYGVRASQGTNYIPGASGINLWAKVEEPFVLHIDVRWVLIFASRVVRVRHVPRCVHVQESLQTDIALCEVKLALEAWRVTHHPVGFALTSDFTVVGSSVMNAHH